MLVPVYDIKNCGPRHRFVANGKLVHNSDGINLQNLTSNPKNPNAGKIKKTIVAPPGYVVIDCDSSQIEARTLAWLAGQQDLLDAFEAKQDVYKIMASRIYGKPVSDITGIERQVGKVVILGAGYGVGHAKLKLFLKTIAGVDVTEVEAKRIIDAYRAAYPRIPELWRKADDSLRALAMGNGMQVDAVGVVHAVPDKGLSLPNGLHIQYPSLRQQLTAESKKEWVYLSKGMSVKVYGGKCLAADTPVLTPRGWVPLVDIHATDKVWDGSEWVNHQGLTYQGEKATILLSGVRMTPDHQVLTSKGWKDASSCQGLHRADVRMPDGSAVRGNEWATFSVGVSMCMRNPRDSWGIRHTKIRTAGRKLLMRMSNRQEKPVSRVIQTPRILGLAVYARSVSIAITSGMGKLRWARDTSMSAMGSIFRDVLGRHGRNLYAGANAGPHGQLGELHPRELPVGNVQGASRKPSRVPASRYAESAGNHQYFKIDTPLPVAPEPVYDLLNAGPRTRFMVLGDAGPFVVHNCVENFCQAVARCIIAEQMLRISKRYKVVLTVHDAIAIVAKVEEADEARAFVEECMRWRPLWAQALPLACESGMGASYGDC